MPKILRILCTYSRYDLPLWLVRLLTAWWPDLGPVPRIRGALCSLFIAKCGKGFALARDVTLNAPNRLIIGNHVYLAKGTWVDAFGGVEMEDEVLAGPYVVIVSSNHGFKDDSPRFGGTHVAPVKVGRGTWLAAHVVVGAGVTIGKGNLVVANSVVIKSTPDDVLVAGIPAKVIRSREDNPGESVSRHD